MIKRKNGWTDKDPDKVFSKAIKRWLTKAARKVQGDAMLLAPVDTGRLAGSITYEVFKDRAEIGTNVEYAPYVEYGTVNMSAQPYLRPALDENRKNITKMLRDELRRAWR